MAADQEVQEDQEDGGGAMEMEVVVVALVLMEVLGDRGGRGGFYPNNLRHFEISPATGGGGGGAFWPGRRKQGYC